MAIHDSYSLLTLEGHLFRAALTHGLTTLRAANLHAKGTFYSAFFGLSIGIERLMKVVLIVDHMAGHSMKAPTDRILRRHGHDLVSLFDYLKSLPISVPNPLLCISHPSLAFRILKFLSDFAETTRYYNLDSLVTSRSFADPLSKWQNIISAILLEDTNDRQRRKAQERAMTVSDAVQRAIAAVGDNLDGTPMTFEDAMLLPPVYDLAAGYAVFHVIEVVQALQELLRHCVDKSCQTARSLGMSDCPVPYMTEFLDVFYLDKRLILKKKRWP